MHKSEHVVRFNEWWGSLDPSTKAALDVETARKAFCAGSREGFKGRRRIYKFQTGRWLVSVTALTESEAKLRAIKAFEERAAKLNVDPPKCGWQIVPVAGRLKSLPDVTAAR